MFSLNMWDYSKSFLLLSTLIFFFDGQVGGSEQVLLFGFCCGTPLSCLKVWGGVVAPMILVSAQVPLGLIWVGLGWGLAQGVLGLRDWGQGLTIFFYDNNHLYILETQQASLIPRNLLSKYFYDRQNSILFEVVLKINFMPV